MFGISFIPSQGSQTQKIPPITSVKDSKVKSAAGIFFEPIEYSISPIQTIVPCVANKASFFPDDKKFKSLFINIKVENKKQNKPAIATVVNLGVFFLHLKETENIEKPNDYARPKINPAKVLLPVLLKAIIITPIQAINIAAHTLIDIFSFKNKKPNNAVINGIAAKHKSVTAAVVCVIDQIKVIIAVPNPIPPIRPEIPTLR